MTRRLSPLILGAALGACLVAFAVLAGLFVRDLVLSGQACLVEMRDFPPAAVFLELCANRTRATAHRLWFEVPALVLAGGLLGAALARWRHRVRPTSG